MPIDPRRQATTPEAQRADKFADLERRVARLEAGSLQRVVAAQVRRTGASLTSGVLTAITFDTVDFDTANSWTPPDTLTAPIAGVYLIAAWASFDGNATGARRLEISNSQFTSTHQTVNSAITSYTNTISGFAVLDVGETTRLILYQDSGTARTVDAVLAWARLGTYDG